MNQELLTVEEMAKNLKVSKAWVYRYTRDTGPDAIPRVYAGRYIRFVESDVMDWLRKQNSQGRNEK